ncbi:translocation/assembly module TamB domain-containing protein [Lewinella cohaerens]|uniref:translocation/assembly module TamB domain-containing protein n=1 Tax=Lewinella cohaerens TaxID=70995 RepID=UPI0003659BDC|nr:translocation/assembly module TamB domain-containing protein [Lewinella cohaerens]
MSDTTTPITDPVTEPDGPPPRKKRWWVKVLRWIALSFLAIFIALQLPFVQQKIAQYVVKRMEQTLGTPVSLESVKIAWFDELTLQSLYIEDSYGDTLLASGHLIADFNLSPLAIYRRGIEIEALDLQGARFNIQRALGDSLSNLQVTLLKLFPPKAQVDTASKRPLPFNLKELYLKDVQFTQNDSLKGSYLGVYLTESQIYVNNMDLAAQKIDVNSINIRRPVVTLNSWNGPPIPEPLEILDSLVQASTDDSLFELSIGEFQLSRGQFRHHNYRKAPVKLTAADQLDLKHLDLYDLQVEIDSFHLLGDEYQGRVNWIAAKDRSGFQLERLSAKEAIVSPREMTLNGLSIITPTSSLGDTLRFQYKSFADWAYFEDEVRMDARFNDADVTLKDIMAFVPKLNDNIFFSTNQNTNLQIDGRIRGTVNNLRGSNLELNLADGTTLEGKFSSRNLAVKNEEFLTLDLKQFTTQVRTLRQLIPNFNPPPNFDKLGRLSFDGSFIGFFVDFVADGNLRTDLGKASLDMQMVLTEGAQRARYSGNLNLVDFDLGGWTSNSAFGLVNFNSKVEDGFGLTGDLASAKLTAAIESITIKDYTYENASITGQLNKNFFNGDLSIKDENIDFAFTGEIDFTDTVPTFDFNAALNRLALQPLNLSPADLVLQGDIDLKLRNTQFSKMEGDVNLSNIKLTKNQEEEYDIEYIRAFTFFAQDGEKVFRLDSDIARGEIRGAYDLNELPASLQLFLLRNYPGFAGRLGFKEPRRIPDVNQFSFDFHLADSKGLNYLVDPKLGMLQDIDLNGRYNGNNDSLIFYLEVPQITYDKIRLADVYVHMDALKSEGDLDIVIDSTIINGKPRLNTFTFLSILQSDTIDFAINISTDTPNLFDQVNLNGLFYLPDSVDYALQLRRSNLSLLQTPWAIDEDNLIRFGQGQISAENFSLSNQDRKIHIRNNGNKGLRVQLANFHFSFLDDLWDYDPLNFSGNFDMLVQVDDVFKMEGLNAVMTGEDFYINKDNFGRFSLEATAPNIKSRLNALVTLRKDSTWMEVQAKYNLADLGDKSVIRRQIPLPRQKNYLDLNAKFGGFPLSIAEYWLGGGMSETHGIFSADLQIKGLTNELGATGAIVARNGGFTLNALKTHYTFREGIIKMTPDLFDATGTVIYDKYGNSAVVEGGITHENLRHMGLAARMQTRRFLGIDLAKGDNDLFYGRAIGSGEVVFSGDFQRPNIYINGTVGDSTYIVIPVTDQAERNDLDFVKFINKHQGTQQTSTGTNTKIKGLNLEMDLQVTEVAELELIFDEKAGDILKGRGRGNLRILLPRAEEFQMYGDITVSSGNYLFTLYDVINKDFRISPGGKINWNGDPLNAQIDISAEYKDLKTSLTTFIQEYLVNAPPAEQLQAKQATDVNLILGLKGDLFSPAISFDIGFPNLQGIMANLAENKLNVLRQEQNEMNKQVFGLIVLGQFLPSDLSFNSTELFANTLSEYFSNQLSLLLTDLFSEVVGNGKTISSLDFEFDYNRVTSEDLTNSQSTTFGDAVEINLRSGLLNERLSLDIGGNFEFGQTTTNGTFFGENIVLEYAISENRDLKIRLYERRDQDIGGDRRIQVGTGLSWRKEFNSFSEFWKSVKGKK